MSLDFETTFLGMRAPTQPTTDYSKNLISLAVAVHSQELSKLTS